MNMNARQLHAIKLLAPYRFSPSDQTMHDMILETVLSDRDVVALLNVYGNSAMQGEPYWVDCVTALFIARQEEAPKMLNFMADAFDVGRLSVLHDFIPYAVIGLIEANNFCSKTGRYINHDFAASLPTTIGRMISAYVAGGGGPYPKCSKWTSGKISGAFASYLDGICARHRATAIARKTMHITSVEADVAPVVDALVHQMFNQLELPQQMKVLSGALATDM